MGELALSPFMFGASSTLLNANHYDVYFRGMPSWNGQVFHYLGQYNFAFEFTFADSTEAWGCF